MYWYLFIASTVSQEWLIVEEHAAPPQIEIIN